MAPLLRASSHSRVGANCAMSKSSCFLNPQFPLRPTLLHSHRLHAPPSNRLLSHTLKASNRVDGGGQIDPSTPEDAATSASASVETPYFEPEVVEAEEAAEQMEASRVIEGDSPSAQDELLFPQLPDAKTSFLLTALTGLTGVYAVMGVVLAAATIYDPALGATSLFADVLSMGSYATSMMGLVGVGLIRVAALITHIKEGIEEAELGTWRIQRLNLALLIYSSVTSLAILPALGAVSPLVTIPMLVLSLATVATMLKVMHESLDLAPFLQWTIVPGDLINTGRILSMYVWRDVSSLAGILMVICTLLSVQGAFGLLMDVGSWQTSYIAEQLKWSMQSTTVLGSAGGDGAAASVAMLRRLAGAGLVVYAATAHLMLEFCDHVRVQSFMEFLKSTIQQHLESRDPMMNFINPHPGRYNSINWGVFVTMILQAYLLWEAPSLGIDVNFDAAFWAPAFGTAAVSIFYMVAVLFRLDWASLWNLFLGSMVSFMRFLYWCFDRMVLPFETTKNQRYAK